ncbi:MAGE domain-containing protein [Mycena kentingensis (nom. inval.)]|nr:MAGE domain-containing protein [Mycena kentingensis (nom. inval.)]
MPRATTRTQKLAKASQSQPTQTQRSQKRRQPSEPEEDDDDDQEENINMDVDDDEDDNDKTDEKRMAYSLVRLAMFNEHRRLPLRRDEISKKVLGSNTRAFGRVFAVAQGILQSTLGMEMVELRTRAELDPDAAKANEVGEDGRNAAGVKKKASAAGSKTYILRSTLSPELIAAMATTHEDILEVEAEDDPSEDEDDDYSVKNYGNMLAWSKADQLAPLGILYVILALILVSGRTIGDQDLRTMLKRLNLTGTTVIPFTPASTHPGNALSLDAYLTQLIKQGYLDRAQVGAAADAAKAKGKGRGAGAGKRARVSAADEEAGMAYEWRWGPRAASEVGEQAIGKFIAEFMVGQQLGDVEEEDDDEEGAGAGRSAARARKQKQKVDAKARYEKMLSGVARAAGGELAEIK